MNKRINALAIALLILLPIVTVAMPLTYAAATLSSIPDVFVESPVGSMIFLSGSGYTPLAPLYWQVNTVEGWQAFGDPDIEYYGQDFSATSDGAIPDGAFIPDGGTFLFSVGDYYVHVSDGDPGDNIAVTPIRVVAEPDPRIVFVETQYVEVGDDVEIEGEGFTPGAVDLYWDGVFMETVTTNEFGELDETITIPETAKYNIYGERAHWFMAIDEEGMSARYVDSLVNYVWFRIYPSVDTVLSIDGEEDTSFQISGHGFPAGKTILASTVDTPRWNIVLDPDFKFLTYHPEVEIADDGTFTVTLTLAEDILPETGYMDMYFEYSDATYDDVYDVVIVSRPDRLGDEVLYDIYNIDEDDWNDGYVGDSIEVTIWNFRDGVDVTIMWGSVTLGTITTDSNGAGQKIFTVPELPGKEYVVVAIYEPDGLRAYEYFDIEPIVRLYDAATGEVIWDPDEPLEYVESGTVVRIVATGFDPQTEHELLYGSEWWDSAARLYDILRDRLFVEVTKGTIVEDPGFDFMIETTDLGSFEITFVVTYMAPLPYDPMEPNTEHEMFVWVEGWGEAWFLAVGTPYFYEDYYTAIPGEEEIYPAEVEISNLVPFRTYQLLLDGTPLMLRYDLEEKDYFRANEPGDSPGMTFPIPSEGVYSLSVVNRGTTIPLGSVPFIVSSPPETVLPVGAEIVLIEDTGVYGQEMVLVGWNFMTDENVDIFMTGYGWITDLNTDEDTGALYYEFELDDLETEGGVYGMYVQRYVGDVTYQVGPALLTIQPRLLLYDLNEVFKGDILWLEYMTEELTLTIDTASIYTEMGEEYIHWIYSAMIEVEAHGLSPDTYYVVVWDVEDTQVVLWDSKFQTDEYGSGWSDPVLVPAALEGDYRVGVAPAADPTAIVESYRLDRFEEFSYEEFPLVHAVSWVDLKPEEEAIPGQLVSYEFDFRWLIDEQWWTFYPIEGFAEGNDVPIYVTVYLNGEPVVYATVDFAVRSITDGGSVSGTLNGAFDGTVDGELSGTTSGTFDGTVDGTLSGTMTGSVDGVIDGWFVGELFGFIDIGGVIEGWFNGPLGGTFSGTMDGTFDGTFSGTMTGTFDGTFDGTFSGTMTGTFSGTFSGTFEFFLVPVVAIHGISTGATFRWQDGIMSGSFIMPDGQPNELVEFTLEYLWLDSIATARYEGFKTSAAIIRAPSLLAQILAKLDEVDAHIVEVITDAKGEIIVKIDSALGTVIASLDEIKGKLDRIEDGMAVIDTKLGEIQVKLDEIKAQIVGVITTAEGNIIVAIDTALGTVTAKLNEIDAHIVGVITDAKGEILAVIETALGTVTAKLDDIKAEIVAIDGKLVTIQTEIGTIQAKLDDIKAELTSIKGTIATIKTDVGTIKTDVTNINAKIAGFEAQMAIIITDLGQIKVRTEDIFTTVVALDGRMAQVETSIGTIQVDFEGINARFDSIDEDMVLIKTDIGITKTHLTDLNTRITVINSNIAIIETDLGTIKGTVTSIQGDIFTIKTDIGTIKTTADSIETTGESIKTDTSLQPATVALSLIAAISAIAAAVMVLRKVYMK